MKTQDTVIVIGAGLAGSEAAWQLAKQGIYVKLYEMRPGQMTPAHHTPHFAELVCSNSLRSNQLTNGVGLLKEEMRRFDSLIIRIADETQVPAGGALAVDRENFSKQVTEVLSNHPNIEIVRKELKEIPSEGYVIIATGPLTSKALSSQIQRLTGADSFYFYDAAAPIVEKDSLNMNIVYLKSRYDKGEAAYLNCPMNQKQFEMFYEALIHAQTAPLNSFEKEKYFEGCMPIEVLANRGLKTLLFGPLKPVGLEDPRTGERPYAVVQLRQDNAAGTLYNLVGFQTHLKWSEQKRVFQMIPGLENANFVRYGVMHRNTFLNSPVLLNEDFSFKAEDRIYFAGQMTGVEGYVESAASGLSAGYHLARRLKNFPVRLFPRATMIGSMAYYITHTNAKNFQPMNANFGLLPPLSKKIRNKKEKYEQMASYSLQIISNYLN
ncbi:MAG TPA: methylenetetrahydrofolate--tRNA-(uracil(54)-C(5))-methyltransferase (FADH(2)-oxidizing) TrmFO [Firmicutes bacterium]|nr:methylenetetrahydrofolate--tRNA-(uracil(54)-C(5))-methyltransferase (FADH(2)-oxidizing) TrmFO [Bacillales bacterium]HJA40926.1 methylenetetrahydrofolate--tRNA-(uracil(54)-C(5))-methyltransferase (FADH(2)-oxidizing) TrmFO [Bacillota bacterium]